MKTAGIIKIIVGCIVLVALCAIVAGLLLGNAAWNRSGLGHMEIALPFEAVNEPRGESPQNGAGAPAGDTAQIVGDIRYPAAELRSIEADWIAGSVEVVICEGEEVQLSERSNVALTESQRMRCTLRDGKLKIEYCHDAKNVWRWFSLGNYNLPAKSLTIGLPASLVGALQELEIETVSADVRLDAAYAQDNELDSTSGELRMTGIDCHELSAQSVSGDIIVSDCSADELDLETVSGDVEAMGAFGRIKGKSVSGSLDCQSTAVPRQVEMHSVSGSISLTLPADAEFTASLDTVSGELSSDFPCVVSKDRLVAGSGANRYSFESVSGDVRILKAA